MFGSYCCCGPVSTTLTHVASDAGTVRNILPHFCKIAVQLYPSVTYYRRIIFNFNVSRHRLPPYGPQVVAI